MIEKIRFPGCPCTFTTTNTVAFGGTVGLGGGGGGGGGVCHHGRSMMRKNRKKKHLYVSAFSRQ